MADYVVFLRTERRQMARLVMFLLELPRRDPVLGGGIFPDTLAPPPSVCPKHFPGWTTRHVDWVKHPDNTGADADKFAIRITPELEAAWLARRHLLTAQQRQWVQDHLATRAELTLDWRRSMPQPGGGTVDMIVEDEDVEPEP